MKRKYWIPAISLLFLINVLFIAGCSQTKTQITSPPTTTITTTTGVPTITPPDAYSLIQQNIDNPDFVILDVRTAAEFNAGHIAGAVNIDYESTQFTTDVSLLDKNQQYLAYCATGVRGAAATQIMVGLGFKNVQNIAGGITAWIQHGYPTTSPTTTESTTTIPSVTTTSTAKQPTTTKPTTTTVTSTNGLQLQVSVNNTSLTLGEPLQISVSEYNTLSTTNNVTATTKWAVNGLTIGACPNINVQPFGVAIFHGNYTAQNILQETPLNIYAVVACPQFIRLITGYEFLPHSINAAIMPGGDLTSPTPMSATVTVNVEPTHREPN